MIRVLSITIVCMSVAALCIDSVFAETQGEHKTTLRVDAEANCLFMTQTVQPAKRTIGLQLRHGYEYRVSAAGAAYFSPQTGKDADPIPGVFVVYSTSQAGRNTTRVDVVSPGKELRFRTPSAELENPAKVFLSAFFVDYWDASKNHGGYDLAVVGMPVGAGKTGDE